MAAIRMNSHYMLDGFLTRDRRIIITGLVCVTLLAWAYMFFLAWQMEPMQSNAQMAAMHVKPWTAIDLVLTFIMWAVMMAAMMVPSAAPVILLFGTLNRKRNPEQNPLSRTLVFLSGYLTVWTAFSVLATGVQWGLHSLALLSPIMVSNSTLLGSVLLISAGVYQFSSSKHVCLDRCRSPLEFFAKEWRTRTRGAWIMGLKHGLYCLGCCWMLMGLLFVLGVMNLIWVAVLAVVVLIEKLVPAGAGFARLAGVVFIGWGCALTVLN